MKRVALLALLVTATASAGAQTWDFDVRLDGKPIGTHRFVVSGLAAAREVASMASFDVRLLGITVYRYRHEAQERWQGDCLRSLKSRTNDDGKVAQVDEQRDAADCLMGFAYWHPALHQQTRLLNPQTGKVEDARFDPLPAAPLLVNGREVAATRWRLTATTPASKQDITLWLDRADGRWIGLDAQVKGRLLTYRLQ
jgi:hypothetical protein